MSAPHLYPRSRVQDKGKARRATQARGKSIEADAKRLALDLTKCQPGPTSTGMPTYEYACTACGSEWEETQRITAPPLEVCPRCGKSSAHRLISAGTGFILKGGGWYSDLYSSAKPPSNKADAKETGPSDAGTKAETTAATAEGAPKKDAPAKAETKPTAPSSPTPTTPTSSTPASSG